MEIKLDIAILKSAYSYFYMHIDMVCKLLSRDMRFPTMWYVDQQRFRPACPYPQSDQSLCLSLKFSLSVKLLTEHHLEFLSLKEGCTGWSESTLVKMPHCWKSRRGSISVF